MLAEAAGPDQRAARKMRPGYCTKKIHPGSPEVTFLGTDTYTELYIVYRVNLNKLLQIIAKLRWSNKNNNN